MKDLFECHDAPNFTGINKTRQFLPVRAPWVMKFLWRPKSQGKYLTVCHNKCEEDYLLSGSWKVVPYTGSWGQCGAAGVHLRCCLDDLCGASLRSPSLMARWQTDHINHDRLKEKLLIIGQK